MSRLGREVAVHLEKARDSAFLAVETYNRPRTNFRSGGYIVLMCIAWTALFHAIFFQRKVKPFYRQKKHRGRFEMLDGDKKTWELSTCLAEFWKNEHPPMRHNLDFFVRLRNKIEHRSMPSLDMRIFGECQALLFNFEETVIHNFGEKAALNESLSFALQFSTHRHEQQEQAFRKLHLMLASDIGAYIDAFRTSLSVNDLQDLKFSYKVFLFPKPANHANSADVSVEFVKYDPANPVEMERIERAVTLIKPVAAPASPVTEINGALAFAATGIPVRLTTNVLAPQVRAFSPDDTHPFRQKDLILRLHELLPLGTRLTSHDLLCIRSEHDIANNPAFYYKSRFGSTQYSEDYAIWILESFIADNAFFENARTRYRER